MSTTCVSDGNCGSGQFCDFDSHTCADMPSQAMPWSTIGIIVTAGIMLVVIYYNIVKRLRAGEPAPKGFLLAAAGVVLVTIVLVFLFRGKTSKCSNQSITCGAGEYAMCNLSTAYAWKCSDGPCTKPGDIYDDKCKICRGQCTGDHKYFDCASKQCTCAPDEETCGNVCCSKGDCFKDEKGAPYCCPAIQQCKNPDGSQKCCQAGTVCSKDNVCVPACGRRDPSDPSTDRLCGGGQICTIISGLNQAAIADIIAKEDPDAIVHGDSLYMCKTDDKLCHFPIEGRQVGPDTITGTGFYPCYMLGKHDASVGMGFCTGKNSGADKTACFASHTTQDTCSADQNCAWWDVLEKAGDMQSLRNEFQAASGQQYGYWCNANAPTEAPYMRVVTAATSGTCTWKDCWNQLAQPGVSDIRWDGKACSVIQGCDGGGGLNNQIVQSDGSVITNPSVINPIDAGSAFYADGCNHSCPVIDPFDCEQGIIGKPKRYGCDANYNCVEDPHGTSTSPDCGGMCEAQRCATTGSNYSYVNGKCARLPPILSTSGHMACDAGGGGCTNDFGASCGAGYSVGCWSSGFDCHGGCSDRSGTVPYRNWYCEGNSDGEDLEDLHWVQCLATGGCPLPNYFNGYGLFYFDQDSGANPSPVSYCSWPPPK